MAKDKGSWLVCLSRSFAANAFSHTCGSVKAVDDLSLEVPVGIVIGFLGPNGAGKTNTSHLLLALLESTQCPVCVLIAKPSIQAENIRSHSGAVLEFAGLYECGSAKVHLGFYRRIYQMPATRQQARIKELLTLGDL